MSVSLDGVTGEVVINVFCDLYPNGLIGRRRELALWLVALPDVCRRANDTYARWRLACDRLRRLDGLRAPPPKRRSVRTLEEGWLVRKRRLLERLRTDADFWGRLTTLFDRVLWLMSNEEYDRAKTLYGRRGDRAEPIDLRGDLGVVPGGRPRGAPA